MTKEAALAQSPRLAALVAELGIDLKEVHWDGQVESLPTKREAPALVRASSMMNCGWDELGLVCQRGGHLAIYNDSLVLLDGRTTPDTFAATVREFLKANARVITAPAASKPPAFSQPSYPYSIQVTKVSGRPGYVHKTKKPKGKRRKERARGRRGRGGQRYW